MTLILTALHKNGVCVCADKRSQTWTNGVLEKTEDNLNKIYKFKEIPLLIFNHGVNKFNNISWESLCSDYEGKSGWRNKKMKLIAEDFKDFVNDAIIKQLNHNIQTMPGIEGVRKSYFVLCGKDIYTGKYEFHELSWSPNFSSSFWNDTRIIGSGEGYKKYLEQYLLDNKQSQTIEAWGARDTQQAKEELQRLFSIALRNRDAVQGNEFSDEHDIECLFSSGLSV